MPKKTKLRLKKRFIVLFASILLIIAVLIFNHQRDNQKLINLGYDKVIISEIRKEGLKKTLLTRDEFSSSLNQAFLDDNYDQKYLELYFVKNEITDDELKLYDRLLENNYSAEITLNFFRQLEFREITPLLVFDTVDPQTYIDDVLAHRSTNIDQFVLSGDYLVPYENYTTTDITKEHLMLVNNKTKLENYTPELTTVVNECRMRVMELEVNTNEAYTQMCYAMREADLWPASDEAYRSFETQTELYNEITSDGKYNLDVVAKPGFSEHETGLAVDIINLSSEVSVADSPEYAWLKDNAHLFGFIVRFPKGYETITGIQFEPWHYRYLGVETATAVYNSKLTYDEYYNLYLK